MVLVARAWKKFFCTNKTEFKNQFILCFGVRGNYTLADKMVSNSVLGICAQLPFQVSEILYKGTGVQNISPFCTKSTKYMYKQVTNYTVYFLKV